MFRERLLVLIYLISGQPARTTELMNLRHQNTLHGLGRNLFISSGRLCIKTWYHKGIYRTQTYKVILRFMPREASEHFVRFTQLVLPFWQFIQGKITGADTVSPFMWSRQLVYRSSDQQSEWATYEGRHVEMLWGGNHLRDLLSQYSVRLLGQRLIPSVWRHLAVAISRKYLDSIFDEFSADGHESGSDSSGEENDPLSLQTTHTRFTRDTIYGRTVSYGGGGRASEADGFLKASLLWHRFLAPGDLHDLLDGKKRKYESFEQQWDKARSRRLIRLQGANLLAHLRMMLRTPDATFRGQQEAVIQAIVRGVHPILYVEGTGAGKTMAAVLPAYCSTEGISVVVVPLLSLRDDILERCERMQIPAGYWTTSATSAIYSTAQAARLLVVTAESATTKTFQEYMARLVVQGQLDRVFVDECHSILDSSADFRPQMRDIGLSLADVGVQLVFMTATLPPSDEARFFRILRMPRSAFTIFRGRTTRTNIRYEVVEASRPFEQEQLVVEAARLFVTQSLPGDKAVIYCMSVQHGIRLSKTLGCDVYHSKVGNEAEKSRIMNNWRNRGGLIAATNALGLGLDIPNIRLVIHLGAPRTLRDYCQESGRAGRDAKPCRAIIYHCRNSGVHPAVREYVGGLLCRRAVVDKEMDSFARDRGCIESEEQCDVCERLAAEVEERRIMEEQKAAEELEMANRVARIAHWSKSIAQRVARDAAADYDRLQVYIRQWEGPYCIGCHIQPDIQPGRASITHTAAECPLDSDKAAQAADSFRQELFLNRRLQKYSGCFFCGFPQAVCPSWTVRGQGAKVSYTRSRESCPYQGLLPRVLGWAWVLREEEVKVIIRSAGGLRGDLGDTGFYTWLGTRVRWATVETNYACVTLAILMRYLDSR